MSTAPDLRALLRKIIEEEYPWLALGGTVHTYRVESVRADGRVDLRAVSGLVGDIPNVDHWAGIGGTETAPKVGTLVAVAFRDGDAAKPMLVNYQPLRVAGGIPDKVQINADLLEFAGGGPAVSRVGDSVDGGTVTAVAGATPVTFTYTPPGGVPGVPGATLSISGVITSGSAKVTSG